MMNAIAYLQVEPLVSDNGTVYGAKVVRCTQRAPGLNQLGGTVLLALTIGVPASAFEPLHADVALEVDDVVVAIEPVDPRPVDDA